MKITFNRETNRATIYREGMHNANVDENQFPEMFSREICRIMGFTDKVQNKIREDIINILNSNDTFESALQEMKNAGMLK